jgi:hypothetical protein
LEKEPVNANLTAACGRLLEPIIRFLIRNRVSWKEFSELAKVTFVQVATSDFGISGRPTNASRVAILTGLDRRDVRKLRAAITENQPPARGYITKAAQVLDAWHHDPEFIDGNKRPRSLALHGGGPSITTLVRKFAPGLPPVAMVKELRAAGSIAELPDGTWRPLQRHYIPRYMSEEQIRLWSSTIEDLASTIGYNLTRAEGKPTLFERRAVNRRIDPSSMPAFKAFLEQEGQQFLERVDDWLSAHEVAAEADNKAVRLGAGIYQIQDSLR